MLFINNYFTIQKFILFCDKIITLLSAGFDLIKAIEIIIEDEKNHSYQKKLLILKKQLLEGKNISVSLKVLFSNDLPLKFEKLTVIPDLTLFFQELKTYYQEKIKLIDRIWQKLLYPFFLLISIFIIIIIFFTILLPFYQNFFLDFNLKPPLIFTIFLNINQFLSKFSLILFFTLIFLFIIFYQTLNHMCNKLTNKLFFQENLSDFLWLLSLLLKNGFDINTAFDAIIFSDTNFNKKITAVKTNFYQNSGFANQIKKFFPISNYYYQRLQIAEKNQNFNDQLKQISQELQQQDYKKRLFIINLLPGIILLFIGFFIFALIYLSFIPMLSIINNL